MSERDQALMRTRCPECGTIFRVTSEQLRRKAGKVRCGQCQAVFNAFDHWQVDSDETLVAASVEESSTISPPEQPVEPELASVSLIGEPEPFDPSETIVAGSDWAWRESLASPAVVIDDVIAAEPALVGNELAEATAAISAAKAEEADISEVVPFDAAETLVASPADRWGNEEDRDETPEQSTLAAREAGLVAARELAESSSYNRWAAGTLAGDGRGAFDVESPKRANWPFVLASVLLLIGLMLQVFHHYRTEIVLRMPSTQSMYELFGIDMPLPRNPGLVSIETSDYSPTTRAACSCCRPH